MVLIGSLKAGSWFIQPLAGPVPVRIAGTLALCILGAGAYFLATNLLGLSDVRMLLRRGSPKKD